MNADVKTKWVAKLRSGAYKQGKGSLQKNGKFCCLGVLCDLFKEEGHNGHWEPLPGGLEVFVTPTQSFESSLPLNVQNWAGLKYLDPLIGNRSATDLNDRGMSFGEIADLIETHL